MTIPDDHIRSCDVHGVVSAADHPCPCCETGVEARPGAFDGDITDIHMRQQMSADRIVEILPLLEQDAERAGEGPVYVAVAEVPEADVRGAAGYTFQERWFNVVMVDVGQNTISIVRGQDAREAIETIEAGEAFIESPEYGYDRLAPDKWEGVAEAYCGNVEYDRVAEETLRITMDRFGNDSHYRVARNEIGQIAKSRDLTVRTVEAGGRFSRGVVDVSIPDGDGG